MSKALALIYLISLGATVVGLALLYLAAKLIDRQQPAPEIHEHVTGEFQ